MKKIIIIPILISLVISSFDSHHYKQRNKQQETAEKKEIAFDGLKQISKDCEFLYFVDPKTDVMYLKVDLAEMFIH